MVDAECYVDIQDDDFTKKVEHLKRLNEELVCFTCTLFGVVQYHSNPFLNDNNNNSRIINTFI